MNIYLNDHGGRMEHAFQYRLQQRPNGGRPVLNHHPFAWR